MLVLSSDGLECCDLEEAEAAVSLTTDAVAAAREGVGMGLLRPCVCRQPQVQLWISAVCVSCVSPSSGPSDACPFPPPSPPSVRVHTYTHTPAVVLRQKADWRLVSCIDLPVADTLSQPVITK